MERNKPQNLNEELNRMKRLMNFDVSQNSHDILSENSMIEQKKLKVTKKEDGDFRVKKGRTRYIGKSGKSDEVDYEDRDWSDNSDSRKQGLIKRFKENPWDIISGRMMEHMSEKSKSNWTELINDPDNVGYAVKALELYDEDYSNLKGKQKKKLRIIVGHDEQIEYEIEQYEPKEVPDIIVPLELPVDSSPSELFEDCKYEPTEEFVSEIDNLISKINEQKKEMSDPYVECSYIKVESSASRLRNTCKDDKNLSWLKLSKLRNDAALNYIKSRLSESGVVVDNNTKVNQNYKGLNGDGSSGPNPPEGYRYNNDGTGSFSCGDKTEKGQKCKGTRNDFGQPLSNLSDYDEFKFVIMDVGLIFKGQKEPDTSEEDKEPKVKEVETESYNIQFYVPPTGFSFWLPKIMIKLPKWKFRLVGGKSRKKPKSWGSTKCNNPR